MEWDTRPSEHRLSILPQSVRLSIALCAHVVPFRWAYGFSLALNPGREAGFGSTDLRPAGSIAVGIIRHDPGCSPGTHHRLGVLSFPWEKGLHASAR